MSKFIIRKLSDIPEEAMKSLTLDIIGLVSVNIGDPEFEGMEELVEFIKEGWDYVETTDSNYIYKTYKYITKDRRWQFNAFGSSYRKDQCVCDQEMSGEVELLDLESLKSEKEKKDNLLYENNLKLWEEFFVGKTMDQLKNKLKTYLFE